MDFYSFNIAVKKSPSGIPPHLLRSLSVFAKHEGRAAKDVCIDVWGHLGTYWSGYVGGALAAGLMLLVRPRGSGKGGACARGTAGVIRITPKGREILAQIERDAREIYAARAAKSFDPGEF